MKQCIVLPALVNSTKRFFIHAFLARQRATSSANQRIERAGVIGNRSLPSFEKSKK